MTPDRSSRSKYSILLALENAQ
eukprot:COSAG04_NODE_23272_length_341_cov_0.818182_1_plen_21_part_10